MCFSFVVISFVKSAASVLAAILSLIFGIRLYSIRSPNKVYQTVVRPLSSIPDRTSSPDRTCSRRPKIVPIYRSNDPIRDLGVTSKVRMPRNVLLYGLNRSYS